MSGITAHVLDLSVGRPAAGLRITLARGQGGPDFVEVTSVSTDRDGRVPDLTAGIGIDPGVYRITFESGAYFAARGQATLYPQVEVMFAVTATEEHYHIPLLLSPFGYSTYRGS